MSKKMTAEEFLKKYNGAPFDNHELAMAAREVDGLLGDAARGFLLSEDIFTKVLEHLGYEEG